MNQPLSLYDYISFVLPGGLVTAVAIWGWYHGPTHDPRAAAVAGLVAVAFVVGHVLAAFANLVVQPLLFLQRPGTRVDSTAGVFGRFGRYDAAEEKVIRDWFAERYGRGTSLQSAFNLAYTELRNSGWNSGLETINEQLGFYRNMTAASVVAIALVLAYAASGRPGVALWPWLPILGVALVAFAYRFRRMWASFGDYVIRGIRTQPSAGRQADDRRER
jgi:hypothetical protein